MNARRKSAKRTGPTRQDGMATRQQLLEAAGAVFAEHGYAKATSKEICERAKANVAAVNYHFGGKDALYTAVLAEAHTRLVSLDALATTANSDAQPRMKLRTLISRLVGEISRRDQGAWELRVLSRELLSQSPSLDALVDNEIAPKSRYLRMILGELMDLPPEHPAVGHTVLSVIGPIVLLLISNRRLQQKIAPQLELNAETLTDHMLAYSLAGMRAVARTMKS